MKSDALFYGNSCPEDACVLGIRILLDEVEEACSWAGTLHLSR